MLGVHEQMAMEAQRGSTVCLGELKRQQNREGKKAETFKECWVQISTLPLISQEL